MRLRSGDPETIGGYPLEARLGAGGMGTVYLARTASGRRIAIKLIHRHYADDEEFRTRFRQEVSAARRVSGAFTAAVVDADPEAEHPWMATAYITGDTLAQRIAEGGPLRGAELRTLAVGLTEALRDIHRAGVVHRDLKPSNVVLSPEGPRVIDFGISRAADHQTLTMTGRVIGTPPFMSPEQLQSPRDVGPESDVFSLGTLLVYAATGQGPFDADSPYMTAYQVVHEEPSLGAVPAALRDVVEPCLAKDPELRPSADALLGRLLALPLDSGDGDGDRDGDGDMGTHVLRSLAAPHDGDRTAAVRPTGTPPEGGARPAEPHGTPGEPKAEPRPDSTRSRTLTGRRLLRNRRRSVLAAVVAIAAIAGGMALLSPGQDPAGPAGDPGRDGNGPRAVAGSDLKLPAGFRPWKVQIRGGRGITDELRCESRGASVYCGGGGVVAARLKVSDGTTAWRKESPGVPAQGEYLIGVAGGADGAEGTGGSKASAGTAGTAGTAGGSGAEGAGSPDSAAGPASVTAPTTVLGYRQTEEPNARSEAVALDADSGKELWSTPVGAPGAMFTPTGDDAVLHDRRALVSVDEGNTRLEYRQARSGKVRWTTPFPAGTRCAPYAPQTPRSSGTGAAPLYALCGTDAEIEATDLRNATVHRVDPADGSLGEATPLRGRLRAVGATGGGKLVFVREHRDGYSLDGYDAVALLDPRTGEVTTKPLPKGPLSTGAAPRLVDGTLYLVSPGGKVTAVDPATGREKWSRQTGAEEASGPVAAGDVLYVSSPTGRVAALHARDGKLLWDTDPRAESPGGDVSAGPRIAVAGRALVVSAGENVVFGFDTKSPRQSGTSD